MPVHQKIQKRKVSLYYIRHALACSNILLEDINPITMLYEKPSGLADRGIKMARYTAECLKKPLIQKANVCICSFMPRAIQTAMILLHGTNQPLYVVPDIHELRKKELFGLDVQNKPPYDTVIEMKDFINAFKKEQKLDTNVICDFVANKKLLEIASPKKWYNNQLPTVMEILCNKQQESKKALTVVVVTHGAYIRDLVKIGGYNFSNIQKQPQRLNLTLQQLTQQQQRQKRSNKQQHAQTRSPCRQRERSLEKNEIPNTSVWVETGNVISESFTEGHFETEQFQKYYVPPENIYPFISPKKSQRHYGEEDYKRCDYKKINKRMLQKGSPTRTLK